MANRQLYALPSYASEFLQVPLVDAPVTAFQSPGVLSENGQGSIRDSLNKRVLHKGKYIAIAIRTSATASIASRAAIVWTRKVLQLIPDNNHSLNGGFTVETTLTGVLDFFKSHGLSGSSQAGILPLQSHSLGLPIPRTVWCCAQQEPDGD